MVWPFFLLTFASHIVLLNWSYYIYTISYAKTNLLSVSYSILWSVINIFHMK